MSLYVDVQVMWEMRHFQTKTQTFQNMPALSMLLQEQNGLLGSRYFPSSIFSDSQPFQHLALTEFRVFLSIKNDKFTSLQGRQLISQREPYKGLGSWMDQNRPAKSIWQPL